MRVFLSDRFYFLASSIVILFIVGYYFPLVFSISKILLLILMVATIIDIYLLFYSGGKIISMRTLSDRLSNGDENPVTLDLSSNYFIPLDMTIYEELPSQLQIRDFTVSRSLKPKSQVHLTYSIYPKTRGTYQFGYTNILIATILGLIRRRLKAGAPAEIRVYPSFIHINNIELSAISQQLTLQGQKRIQKVGNSQEFDSIRPYVIGDDPRHINWKATAKKNALQINHYTDEKSQTMYCLIDKSRSMKMPFNEMALLDYAINASLVLSHVGLKKGDQAGLITFEEKPSTFIKATGNHKQIHHIIEALYREETSYNEVDFTSLYSFTHNNLSQRSLLLLFTNFESIHSLDRQLPYLKMLNRRHLLLVVFFKNTEVHKVLDESAQTMESVYAKVMAHQMLDEKRLINEKLKASGIMTLYTSPQDLSAEVVNRYIEIKNKRIL